MEDKRISTRSQGLTKPVETQDNPETLLSGKSAANNVHPAHHTKNGDNATAPQDSANSKFTPNKENIHYYNVFVLDKMKILIPNQMWLDATWYEWMHDVNPPG